MKKLVLLLAFLLMFGFTANAQQKPDSAPTPSTDDLSKKLSSLTVPKDFNWEQYSVANLPIPVDTLTFARPVPNSIPNAGVGNKLVKDLNLREKMLLYGFSSDNDNWVGLSLFTSINYIKYYLQTNQAPNSFIQLTGLEEIIKPEDSQIAIDKFNTEVAAGNPQPSIIGIISPINNRIPKIYEAQFSPGDMFFMRLPYEEYLKFANETTENNKMLIMVGNFNNDSGILPLPFLTEKPIIDKDSLILYARVYGVDKVIAEVIMVHTEKWEPTKQ